MKRLLAAVAGVAIIVVLHPWTVRPIGGPVSAGTDPIAFAGDLWRTSLIPALSASAVDARTLLDALNASPAQTMKRFGRDDGSGSWYVAVKGSGRILTVEGSSNGLASIDVPPYDRRPDLSLQIGPVINGTSLRDVTTLAPFSRFTNQLQFADVGNALNARSADLVGAMRPAIVPGATVLFTGASSRDVAGSGSLAPVALVQVAIEGAGRD